MMSKMKPDAEIVCRRTCYGDVCEWKGGKVAQMNGQSIAHFAGVKVPRPGMVFTAGRLSLRVVAFPLVGDLGMAYSDSAAVMIESPHAQLYWLYREHAERLVRVIANLETRIWGAWRAFILRPIPEGSLLRFTSWLADRLL